MKIDYVYLDNVKIYFLRINPDYFDNSDKSVACYLNIELKDYINIMKKYGAFLNNTEYYFKTKEECEKFINSPELESYIVMNKLMGE